jgi:hypothetical protein
MLGQKIVEMQGKMTNQRVLPLEQGSPKFESTFEVAGSIFNQPAKTLSPIGQRYCPMGHSTVSAPIKE